MKRFLCVAALLLVAALGPPPAPAAESGAVFEIEITWMDRAPDGAFRFEMLRMYLLPRSPRGGGTDLSGGPNRGSLSFSGSDEELQAMARAGSRAALRGDCDHLANAEVAVAVRFEGARTLRPATARFESPEVLQRVCG